MPRNVFYTTNGAPLAGGIVNTYVPGGTTPAATWQDSAGTILNSNPIILDAAGSCLLLAASAITLAVTDSLGNAVPAYSGVTWPAPFLSAANTFTALNTFANIVATIGTVGGVTFAGGGAISAGAINSTGTIAAAGRL